jgi:hypothetical protein
MSTGLPFRLAGRAGEAQVRWAPRMSRRVRLTATACTLLAFLVVSSAESAGTKKYVSSVCGFSFEYPESWKAVDNPDAAVMDVGIRAGKQPPKCAVGLRPPGWAREIRESALILKAYPVRVVFWNKSFKRAARDSFFIRVGDLELDERPSSIRRLQPWDWGIFVRQGIDPAQQFTTACCQGLRGSSWGHERAKDGSKATISWEGAVINDRRGHTLVVESDEDERFRHTVDVILATARFDAAPN